MRYFYYATIFCESLINFSHIFYSTKERLIRNLYLHSSPLSSVFTRRLNFVIALNISFAAYSSMFLSSVVTHLSTELSQHNKRLKRYCKDPESPEKAGSFSSTSSTTSTRTMVSSFVSETRTHYSLAALVLPRYTIRAIEVAQNKVTGARENSAGGCMCERHACPW